jgi:hypothetical protein
VGAKGYGAFAALEDDGEEQATAKATADSRGEWQKEKQVQRQVRKQIPAGMTEREASTAASAKEISCCYGGTRVSLLGVHTFEPVPEPLCGDDEPSSRQNGYASGRCAGDAYSPVFDSSAGLF